MDRNYLWQHKSIACESYNDWLNQMWFKPETSRIILLRMLSLNADCTQSKQNAIKWVDLYREFPNVDWAFLHYKN